MKTKYVCNYCEQSGGEPLGEDVDGNHVCTKCGFIDEYGDLVHLPEWSWNPTVPFHKGKNINETNDAESQDDK